MRPQARRPIGQRSNRCARAALRCSGHRQLSGESSMQAEFDASGVRAPGVTETADNGSDLFMQGPPMLVEAKLGMLRPGRLHTARRCLLFILITWLPLCMLTAWE